MESLGFTSSVLIIFEQYILYLAPREQIITPKWRLFLSLKQNIRHFWSTTLLPMIPTILYARSTFRNLHKISLKFAKYTRSFSKLAENFLLNFIQIFLEIFPNLYSTAKLDIKTAYKWKNCCRVKTWHNCEGLLPNKLTKTLNPAWCPRCPLESKNHSEKL